MVQIPRSRDCFQRVGLKILSWKSRFQPATVLLPQPVCSTARVELAIEPSMLTPKLRAKEPQTEETNHPQMGESCSLNYRESSILDNLMVNPLKAFVTVVAGMQSKFSSLSPSRISERARLVLGSKLSKARPKISGKTIKVCHNSPLWSKQDSRGSTVCDQCNLVSSSTCLQSSSTGTSNEMAMSSIWFLLKSRKDSIKSPSRKLRASTVFLSLQKERHCS
jgi:hypothetical protein